MNTTAIYILVPGLLGVAFVVLAVRHRNRRRHGHPLHLVPKSVTGRVSAVTVATGIVGLGIAQGNVGSSVIPALTLGGLAGAAADVLHHRRNSPR
ncbi:hypothetical protein SAMN05216371_0165 [Streptomyces sp. TLI_053]|uniref:hypothetical protein n=1 Tax=Streptomyces sp. TLI_053 TaxID=1855352 RepID=UPI00087AC582|nr:hypothetical protein [Streptomyces sp. TLI_053]SDS56185.1 hypothetical protein SAMN05216371_0165 [Streptomyces sp. TLI_053]